MTACQEANSGNVRAAAGTKREAAHKVCRLNGMSSPSVLCAANNVGNVLLNVVERWLDLEPRRLLGLSGELRRNQANESGNDGERVEQQRNISSVVCSQ